MHFGHLQNDYPDFTPYIKLSEIEDTSDEDEKETALHNLNNRLKIITNKGCFDSVDLNAIRGISFSEDSYLALALQKQAKSTEFIKDIGYNYLCKR